MTPQHVAAAAEFQYVGSELAIFEKATNWKNYWCAKIAPFVSGDTLEVGAGIGANTGLLVKNVPYRTWTCLEPDASLAMQIRVKGPGIHALHGTIEDVPSSELFDSILYIDVLEHIEDDRAEMARAAARLKRGGHLVVLSPAHQSLFTPFDAAIGHFRRYSRRALAQAIPQHLHLRTLQYLDAVGMLASLANRILLSQAMPTQRQIQVWDKLMVPASRILDPLCAGHLGKSVLGVWQRES